MIDVARMGMELNDWLDLPGRVALARWREDAGFDAAEAAGRGGVTSPSVCALDKGRLDASLGAFARRKV